MPLAVVVHQTDHQSTQKKKISNTPQLSDILDQYADDYIAAHKLSPRQHKVIFNIRNCQKGEFGYHIDICDKCGHLSRGYNSCHDRHCPQCQGGKRRQWVQARINELLPVPYYHIVFTLPHFLFPLSLYNKAIIYNLLFNCAAQTLLQFGHDPRHLGATLGFYGILHTWGGKLWQHLHVHFIVPGGGLDENGQWVEPKYKGKFLFPVCALSQVFRGKFIEEFKKSYYNNELQLPDELVHLADPCNFEQWLTTLAGRNWVVYSKAPLATPEKAIEALSRYANKDVLADNQLAASHCMPTDDKEVDEPCQSYPEKVVGYIGKYSNRTAIGDEQLVSMNNGRIQFKYKNYRNKGRWEIATLAVEEFIRRFLMHVLPLGFHRIRYFGIFANGKRRGNIEKIRQQLAVFMGDSALSLPSIQKSCPTCGEGCMVSLVVVFPFATIVSKTGLLIQQSLFNTS